MKNITILLNMLRSRNIRFINKKEEPAITINLSYENIRKNLNAYHLKNMSKLLIRQDFNLKPEKEIEKKEKKFLHSILKLFNFKNPNYQTEDIKEMEKMEELFVLQDSRNYIGNNILFWSKKGGYTSNVQEAEIFTKEEALEKFKDRNSDIPLRLEDVMERVKQTCDMQYLQKNDDFYKEFNELKNNLDKINKKKNDEKNIKRYTEDELPYIIDQFSKNFLEEDEVYEEISFIRKNSEAFEYYYPVSRSKNVQEILKDLKKLKFLTQCKNCKKLVTQHYIGNSESLKHKNICDNCLEN